MTKTTTQLILAIALLSTLVACSSKHSDNSQQQPARKPNIVLIMADDLGYETLSSNGSDSYQTPNLDALAAQGMRFTHAHAMPLCTPSRVQLMTGQYNFRNYIGFGMLDPEATTFAQLLKKAGYQTGIAGKWQLHGHKKQRALAGRVGTVPEAAGFDEYLLWQIKEKDGYRYKHPAVVSNGYQQKTITDGYGPDVFVDFIEDFFQRHKQQPFFLYYPMVLAHDPFIPTPDSEEFSDFNPDSNTNDPRYFASNVAYMDKMVGRVMASLQQHGLAENTIVLFLGDNGTDQDVISRWQGQEVRGGKAKTHRWGTHVPLIVNWPNTVAANQVNHNLVDLTDFLPTLLDIAGATKPQQLTLDGLSFYPQLLGNNEKVRDWIFTHYEPRWQGFANARYVYDKNWKLYGDGRFYNLQQDPDELSPLRQDQLDEQTIERKKTLQQVLDNYAAQGSKF